MSSCPEVNVLKLLLQNLKNNAKAMEDLRNSLSKVSQRKISSKKRSDKCVHCEAKVELDKLKEFVTCKGCEELACHNQKCSEFIFGLDVWECARCRRNRVIQQRAGEWLLRQLNQMKGSKESSDVEKSNTENVEDDESLAAFVSRNQRDKVRQFMEELLAKMLDGPLDDVSVGQLSNDEHCLPLIGQIPATITHQELRRFVQSVCEEVINLPNTLDFSGVPGRPEEPLPYFDPKKYEKLLATAVLNKVTDFYQNDKNSQYNSSGVHSDIELDSNHNQLNGKAVIDLMVRRDDAGQFTSSSAIERLNSKVVDDETHLSDYIQSHLVPLPDLSASDSANEEGDVQSLSSNGTDATWEDNWLFKKRKLKTEYQSIAMLVPSPTEEIKALIGDKNADETSDLSENSDTETDENENDNKKKTFTNTLLIEAKNHEIPVKEVSTVIIPSPDSDSLRSMPSLISLDVTDANVITEARNDFLLGIDITPMTMDPVKPVISGEKPLVELSVDVDQPPTADEEFDSIVSPTLIREHKKSIDEQFEQLVFDDNNNCSRDSIFDSPEPMKITKQKPQPKQDQSSQLVPTPASQAQTPTKKDLSDTEDWELVPNADDVHQLLEIFPDQSISIETTTSLLCHPSFSPTLHKSDTFDSQTELAELEKDGEMSGSPKHTRYNSPLFLELLGTPVEPIKITAEVQSPLLKTSPEIEKIPAIPHDESINSLLRVASLVSKTQKSPELPMILEPENLTTTTTNNTNNELPEDSLFNEFSVTAKRPSIQDPEKVLMENVVPGSIAEREHLKWLHAAPIANNPYSTEALQRRLSETEGKQKGLNINSNSKLVEALTEESNNLSEAEKEENEQVFQAKKVDLRKYKRDYYINDASSESQKRYSNSSGTSKSPSFEVDDERFDNIVPVSSGEKGFRARTLHSGDIDSAGGSIASDQDGPETQGNFLTTPKSTRSNDDSLTYSEDSNTTRIYNLNTRETKLLVPSEDVKSESPIESPIKLGQQFFRSSPKKVPDIRKMDDDVTTVIRTVSRNGDDSLELIHEAYEEKQVIEPELVDNLPSVKKLAEIYTKDGKPIQVQLLKPKAFIVPSSDNIEENGTEDHEVPPVVHKKVVKSSSDSFAPNYETIYHPAMPIASITARSIPAQVRADLKKSYSYDEETIVRHGEREGSPEIQAGVTRNSIAFFENLQKK